MSSGTQVDPSSLPEKIQLTGSRGGESLAVAKLYESIVVGAPKSKTSDCLLKSSHLVLVFRSIAFAGGSPPGLLPPGLVTVTPERSRTDAPSLNSNSDSWMLF